MEKTNMLRKTAFALGTGIAIMMAVIAALLCVDVMDTLAEDQLKEATFCSFVVPPEFVPGEERGQFINRNYPMESSSIKYSYYDNGLNIVLTNREKEEDAIKRTVKVTDETKNLTKEIYEETLSAAYNSAYGQDVGFNVSSFTKIKVDGYPGYKIVASYKAADEETVYQTVYMLLSKYRTFTVTYQRAEDDDCESFFEESSSTIHVH